MLWVELDLKSIMALDSDMDRPDNEEKTGTKGSN
jgi:hypothetical protein